ncbi:MAG: addiction module protein [Verrucomicrobiae bacterium]|nr:addiction module protein [Verrucomicrobiae bacterium]
MITIQEIESMSKAERLIAIDLIWSTLSESDKEVSSPAWHGEVLASRMEKVNAGQAGFISLEQLRERLSSKTS